MLRSYRSIVAALVGWLILVGAAQPPQGDNQTNQAAAAESLNQATNTIAAAIRSTIHAPDKDMGCIQGHDERSSDLCAQWKAADSARDAAEYAFWGLIVGVVGTGMLFITFAETRQVSRAQLRAYISIKPMGLKIFQVDAGKQIEASLSIINGGQTPAYNVVWHGNIVALSKDMAVDFFDESNDAPPPYKDPRPTLINSADRIEADLESVDPISLQDWGEVVAGTKNLYLYGTGEYKDVFQRKRYTRFCYLTAQQPLLMINHGGKIKQIPLVWQQAPFFNSAT
ncbi:hypothetical protein ACWGM0_07935 [Sphingomonas bisphenolicum]